MGKHPIGVFDSGYGGLTVFREIVDRLPRYDYIYLGDNARSPYGNRGFETVYQYTRQAVGWFFQQGCPLVILACNTASAKALRTIQQVDLVKSSDPSRRVLGVIRPTAEVIGKYTRTDNLGVLATKGTVASESYLIEIGKHWPQLKVFQHACPMWVPLVESNEHLGPGADYFVKREIDTLLCRQASIDTLLLACTHYPLLMPAIQKHLPAGVQAISQGEIIAESLANYLERHAQMEQRLSLGASHRFYTTDDPDDFESRAGIFFGKPLTAEKVQLPLH